MTPAISEEGFCDIGGETEWSQWVRLGVSPEKVNAYRADPYFAEGLMAMHRHFGAGLDRFAQIGLVMFKPDALACGRVAPALALLEELGYRPLALDRVRLTRHIVRALWPVTVAFGTYERLWLVERLLSFHESIIAFLGCEEYRGSGAALHLFNSKGPADPELRDDEGCMRTRLGSPNRYLTFVHTPDDAADLVREMAVLLDEPALARALQAARAWVDGGDVSADVAGQLAHACSGIPQEHIDLARLVESLPEDGDGAGSGLRERVWTLIDQGDVNQWATLLRQLTAGGDRVLAWRLLVLTTYCLSRSAAWAVRERQRTGG